MLVGFVIVLLIGVSNAMTCADIQGVYNDASCCSNSGSDTCLRVIPSCTTTVPGMVCFNGTDVIVKGLLEAFEFQENRIVFKNHLIPSEHDAFDIGNWEDKVRDIYEEGT